MLGTVISWNLPPGAGRIIEAVEPRPNFIMWIELVSVEEHGPGLKTSGKMLVSRLEKRDPAPLTWFSYLGFEVKPR